MCPLHDYGKTLMDVSIYPLYGIVLSCRNLGQQSAEREHSPAVGLHGLLTVLGHYTGSAAAPVCHIFQVISLDITLAMCNLGCSSSQKKLVSS